MMLSGPGNKICQLMIALLMCMSLAGKTEPKKENITRSSGTTLPNVSSDVSGTIIPSLRGTTTFSTRVSAVVYHISSLLSTILLSKLYPMMRVFVMDTVKPLK